MIKVGDKVEVISLELDPYINTSKEFTIVSNNPYRNIGGWVEIANDKESIITQERYVSLTNKEM